MARPSNAPLRHESVPTEAQVAYLRDLDRQLGRPSTRVPATRFAASNAISLALAQLDMHPDPLPMEPEPTATQLHDLRVLARRAGEPTPNPITRGEAAQHLARLRSASP